MSRARRVVLGGAALALLVAAGLAVFGADPLARLLDPGAPGPYATISATRVIYTSAILQRGQAAPDFELRVLGDAPAPARLSAYRGQPVVVNFWASWCLPCKREMPQLQAAYARGRIVVLGVNALNLDTEDDARAFVRELGVTFPVLLDADGAVQRAYSVRGLPTSVFVAPDGTVSAVQIGEMSAQELEDHLAELGR